MPEPARPPNGVILERDDVPMRARDGVTLRADVWRPDAPGRFPVWQTVFHRSDMPSSIVLPIIPR